METTERIEARVAPEVAQWLADTALEQGVSVGQVLEALVASFIDESKKEG